MLASAGAIAGRVRTFQASPEVSRTVSDEVVDVKALRDDDDGAGLFLIEAREQGGAEPCVDRRSLRSHRFACLQGIVDDDKFSPAAGHRTADRRRQSRAEPGKLFVNPTDLHLLKHTVGSGAFGDKCLRLVVIVLLDSDRDYD
jgi:hypothetical protein